MLRMKMKKSTAGMALMEVMMAVGILTIVTLGITTTISQSMKSQKDAATLGFLASNQVNLTRLIQDGAAWSNTVVGNPGLLSCLLPAASGTCAATATANTYPIRINTLYDSNNHGVYSNSGGNSSSGYTPAGVSCSTFTQQVTAGTYNGSDNCPIQYVMGARFDCPGGVSPCVPVVTVQAQLVYNPSSRSPAVVNTTKYSPLVVRGAGSYVRNDSIFIAQQEWVAAGPPAGQKGGGTCGMSTAAVTRDYTSGISASAPVKAVDTASSSGGYTGQGNILGVDSVQGVQLRAGGYICDVSAVGWAVNGWTLQVYSGGALVAQDSSYAKFEGAYVQSEINLQKIHLDLTGSTYIQVQQTCSTNATIKSLQSPYEQAVATAGYATFAMGIPIAINGTYGNSVYSTISCTRVY